MSPSQNSQGDRLNAALIILTCFSTTVLSAFSVSGPSIALPSIGHDLDLSQAELQWICSAFALSSGCFLLLFGRLADIYGRKLVFLFGTMIAGVSSLACGFAQTRTQIILFRAVQGMGSAATVPAALGILAHTFPPSFRRTVAFSVFSAGNPFGSGLGYILGALAGQYSAVKWRAVFFIGSGIALLSFIGASLVFKNDRATKDTNVKVDWLGAFFITTGLASILFVLGEGTIPGLNSGWLALILVLGLIQIILFVLCEQYLGKHCRFSRDNCPPLMRLDLWTRANGKFAVMQAIAFYEWCAFMSWMIWVQLYYQLYEHYTPVQTMIRLLPMSITGLLLNVLISLIINRINVLWLLTSGTLSTSLACLLFAVIKPTFSHSYWAFGFPASVLAVCGVDFIFACGTLFVASVARKGEESVAGGVFQSVAQLGKAFGLAISTSVYNGVVFLDSSSTSHSTSHSREGAPVPSLRAFKAAQWTAFAFATTSFVLAVLFFRNVGIIGHKPTTNSDSESTSPKLESESQTQTQHSNSDSNQESKNLSLTRVDSTLTFDTFVIVDKPSTSSACTSTKTEENSSICHEDEDCSSTKELSPSGPGPLSVPRHCASCDSLI